MRSAKDLIGKPIYSLDKGQKLGKVKNVYIDSALRNMVGLFLHKEGVIQRKEKLIPYNNIVVVGVNAIVVKHGDVISDSVETDTADWLKVSQLPGRSVDTPGGTHIAKIKDVLFGDDGEVAGFSLGRVSISGPISEDRRFSREAMLDHGHDDGVMTIDLGRAELLARPPQQVEPVTPANDDEPRVRKSLSDIPIRTKITLPYILLTLFMSVAIALVVGQLVLENIEERFTSQLIEAGQLTTDLMVREESRRLETFRLVANTAGVADALQAGDAETLRKVILPIAVNAQEEAVEILRPDGVSLMSLRHREGGNLEDYLYSQGDDTFATWSFVTPIMAKEVQADGRDKYAGIVQAAWGDYFYVAGPILDADGELIGILLVGKSLPTLVRQMRQDTFAQITAYDTRGVPLASTFVVEDSLLLSRDEFEATLAGSESQSLMRNQTVGSLEYTEILAAWTVNGDQEIGVISAALPRTFWVQASQNTRIQLVVLSFVFLLIIIATGILVANRITNPLLDVVKASAAIAQGNLNVSLRPRGNDEVAILANSFNDMVESLREGEIYRDLLGRTVTPEIREELRQSLDSGQLNLDGQTQIATIIFSDVRRFTAISEELGATTIFRLLNEYFATIIPAVKAKNGLTTDFAGDAMLAIFGVLPTPLPPEQSAYQACRAALSMLVLLEAFNAKRRRLNEPEFATGIAVNTGELSAGCVGSDDRVHYTVIGDVVNTSQRMESFTKTFGETGIVLSQQTVDALGERRHEFNLEALGEQQFRGKVEMIELYRLRPQDG